jgi:dipeptidase
MHGEPVGTTTASLVASLPLDRSVPWSVWISFGSPCTSLFLPVYLDGILPPALARGGEAPPSDPSESAWWVFHDLALAAERDPARALPRVRSRFRELEEAIEGDRSIVEREARALALAGESVEAAGLLSDFMTRVTTRGLEHALALTDELRR